MTVRVAAISVDCADALVVGRFWSAALGRPLDPNASSVFAAIGMAEHRDTRGWRLGNEPTWLFAKVPEGKLGGSEAAVVSVSSKPAAPPARKLANGAR